MLVSFFKVHRYSDEAFSMVIERKAQIRRETKLNSRAIIAMNYKKNYARPESIN